jgi:hypothetical protein
MANKYKYMQKQFIQSHASILEIVEISPINLDLSQIEKLLENGRIITPITNKMIIICCFSYF